MTRSVKKHPFGSYYAIESDKPFKQRAHRQARHKVRQLLHTNPTTEILPQPKEFGDSESSGKDRKRYVPALSWDMSFRELIRWLGK